MVSEHCHFTHAHIHRPTKEHTRTHTHTHIYIYIYIIRYIAIEYYTCPAFSFSTSSIVNAIKWWGNSPFERPNTTCILTLNHMYCLFGSINVLCNSAWQMICNTLTSFKLPMKGNLQREVTTVLDVSQECVVATRIHADVVLVEKYYIHMKWNALHMSQ